MTLTTKLECTVLSRVIFSFSNAGIAQHTHSMTCWIPPIWTPTRSPSRSFEKLFACGPNISLDRFKGKFTVTPIFHGKKHGFLGIFPPIQWILQRSIWKSLVRRPPRAPLKSLWSWISNRKFLLSWAFRCYCWTPMRWWKWWVANFYKKHLKAPREKGSFPYEILAIKIWLVW